MTQPQSVPPHASAQDTGSDSKRQITIKKYANRRLYNTATSSYVTLDTLCQMVKDDVDFVVYDAKTSEDITRQVLTQIIVEEEGKGQNMLPISFLRQLIGLYGDNMQWLVPSYLETAMQSFARNQGEMRQYFQESFGSLFPFGSFDQMSKQNIAMIERAMRMFTPFGAPGAAGTGEMKPQAAPPPMGQPVQVSDLKRQLDALQAQIERLNPGTKADKA